jgi:hypothetical protein
VPKLLFTEIVAAGEGMFSFQKKKNLIIIIRIIIIIN